MRLQAQTRRTLCALLFACASACVCAKNGVAQAGGRKATTRESKQTSTRESTQSSARGSKQAARAGATDARRRTDAREAMLALMEAADDARSFDDVNEKADVQALAADALWPLEERAARSILRRAWDATNAPGVISTFTQDDEPNMQAIDDVMSSRRLVVSVAAKHDPRLAEFYVGELASGLPSTEDSGVGVPNSDADSESPPGVWRQLSWEGRQRLVAASGLLEEGAYESAARLVAPVVSEGLSLDLIDFIVALRAKAPREGDALFLRLLETTRVDPQASANDVLLLSQPLISPEMQIFINEDGSAHMRPLSYADETTARAFANASPAIRAAFYSTAAAVLLRPSRQPADGSATSPNTAAIYFAVGRLLPFFEREAAQYAPALRARLNALATELGSGRAQSLNANMETLSHTPKNTADPLAPQLEELSKATDAAARDHLRLRAVLSASRRELWERARTIASEIEDAQTQRDARRVIAIYQVMGVGRAFDDEPKGDDPEGFERAAEFARTSDVPPEFRAAGLAQASELAARAGRRERAEALLEEALVFANQSEWSGWRRLTALAFITRAAAHSGSARTWDLLATLVGYANEVKDLSGVELQFPVMNRPADDGEPAPYVPEDYFNLVNVFEDAARMNFTRTLKEARSLKAGAERALITIAVASASLEKSGKAGGNKAR